MTNTPGLQWRRRGGKRTAYWVCRPSIARKGYPQKTQRLWQGTEPTSTDLEMISDRCHRLQREMRDWNGKLRKQPSAYFDKKGHVYFIRCGNRVKIGFAKDVGRRLRTLQVGSPEPLDLLGTLKGTPDHERLIHWRFRRWREEGEWFRMEGAVSEYVQSLTANE